MRDYQCWWEIKCVIFYIPLTMYSELLNIYSSDKCFTGILNKNTDILKCICEVKLKFYIQQNLYHFIFL